MIDQSDFRKNGVITYTLRCINILFGNLNKTNINFIRFRVNLVTCCFIQRCLSAIAFLSVQIIDKIYALFMTRVNYF